MRVNEIQYGRIYNIEIEQGNREPFQGRELLNVKDEVFLYPSINTGEFILKHRTESIWEVRGINKSNQNILLEIIERKLPILCWLASVHPKNAPKILDIQIHEFPKKLKLSEELHIGIDDVIIDDIRDKHIRKKASITEIIEWLKGQFFILPTLIENGDQRVLLQAGNNPEDDLEISFRLCAKERTINICRTLDNQLKINRIEKFRQSKNDSEQRPVIIIEAKFDFYDVTLKGILRQTVRNDLEGV